MSRALLGDRQEPSALLPEVEVVDRLDRDGLINLATQAAALQARAMARLVLLETPTPLSTAESSPPGQRLTVQQLADRMTRGTDYIYRHKHKWPFTIREGRSVSFDEAGFVRWQAARQRRQ